MKSYDLDTYAGRLAYAMELAGKTNQSEFAREVSALGGGTVTPQSIQHLVASGKGSTHNAKFAQVLGISPLWLEAKRGDMIPSTKPSALAPDINLGPDLAEARFHGTVPLVSWVMAGQFCEAVDINAVGTSDEWFHCPVPHGPRTYALRVSGDSMTNPYPNEKSYPHGVIIYVDPDRPYQNGSNVIAKLPAVNEVTFKKIAMDAGRVFLRPLNPAYPTIEINEELHVCGVVIGSFSFD